MSEWQPIETAPKDGSKILAHMRDNDDLGPLILIWHDERWIVSWDNTDITEHWGDIPTHWMPLPSPPAISENGSKQ